jgi:hypothetical protein
MKFEFDDGKYSHRFEFIFRRDFPDCVDVVSIDRNRPTRTVPVHSAWLIKIENGRIQWNGGEEDFLHLTQEAKDYISKIVKLLMFA